MSRREKFFSLPVASKRGNKIATVIPSRAIPIVIAFAETNFTATAMQPKKNNATPDSMASRNEEGLVVNGNP
jgi:hypothetical protein